MVTMFINQPLGMGVGDGMQITDATCVRQPKMWIATALAIGSLVAGLATSAYSANKASQERKRAEQRQRSQEAQERAWYDRRYNEDYLDTAAGQNLVRRAKEYAKENWQKAAGVQAVTGGTDAAAAIAKNAGTNMVGETLANVGATDQNNKAEVDKMHRQAEANFANMDMQRSMQKAQDITNAGQQASNALMSTAGALSSTNLKGGSNNSTPTTTAVAGENGYVNVYPTRTV